MDEAITSYEDQAPPKRVDEIDGKDGKPLLRAKTVYLFMGSEARVSRSSRMQWLLDHLDSVVTIPCVDTLDKVTSPIQVVAVLPEDPLPCLVQWSTDNASLFHYFIHAETRVVFLSRRYCITYCLDMSPSLSSVDIQNGEVMMDKVFTCLKTSLEAVSKSFIIPGSKLVLHPQIYISIIANTPFFTTPAQQVLVQNWHVTGDNLEDLLRNIQGELLKLENAVAKVSQIYMEQLETYRQELGNMVGGLFEETSGQKRPPQPAVAMVNPDQGFINMLRFGMLALRLLPAASCASILVVTDGVITLPDAYLLDATLNRLRSTGVCCSFLHVGSPFHPHVGAARVPYYDLMEFVATASLGVHMTNIRATTIIDFRDLQMNRFHRAFLTWSFQSHPVPRNPPDMQSNQWFLCNPSFCPGQELQLLQKKQLEDTLNVPLVKLLCCRIREGYVVRSIVLNDGHIEMKLVLGWKYQVQLEYTVRSKWPCATSLSTVHYCLVIRAPYEFLHDISGSKKPFQASFRQAVVSRFWTTIKNFTQSDYLLVHLHSKENNTSWNAVPEGIRSGMPLFYVSTGIPSPLISTNDISNSQFSAFWKPICLLDPDIWHKWLHTFRIGLILRHDYPLPKNLHLTNPSGRFQGIQCRQAATALQVMLRDNTSFVLVDNLSFVKLHPPDEEVSSGWFCIFRITSKPPCVVLNIAFPCGISSHTRSNIVSKLKTQLCELSCPARLPPQERRYVDAQHLPLSRTSSRVACCTVLQKPVEKILVRYERMPTTFDTVVFPDGTQPLLSGRSPVTESGRAGYLVTTLSRYLHHKRWIWGAQTTAGASLGTPAIARVLSTITKMRLQEGFSFAHSQAGIVNMLLEVQMQVNPELGEEVSRCVLQYVLFPPHFKAEEGANQPEGDSDEDEKDGVLQMVTESWVEPHSGLVAGSPAARSYMDQLPYNKLSDAIANVDAQCISSLLTFEHLSLMARSKSVSAPAHMSVITDTTTSHLKDRMVVYDDDDRIHYVPFLFNLLNILPNCRQAELLFLIPVQDLSSNWQVPVKLVDNKEALNPDVKNASLMELIFDQLGKLHDREIHLTEQDSVNFVDHLHRRERDSDAHPIPIPKTGEGPDSPGWRCYLKGISPSHITLTFIPASYGDLKTLMSNTVASTDSKSLKTLTMEDNSIGEFVDWNRKRQSCNSVDEMQEAGVELGPRQATTPNSSSTKNISRIECDPKAFGTLDDSLTNHLQSSLDNLVEPPLGARTATLELSDTTLQLMFSAMSKPYRVRASSLDTNFDKARRRNLHGSNVRTTSMEAKIWANRSCAVSETSGVTRSNTQASEISTEHLDKSSNADAISEDLLPSGELEPVDDLQDTSKVFSTIPLPIFIYDCPLMHLIDTIVYKGGKLMPDH